MRQTAWAFQQRGWNRQAAGGCSGLGTCVADVAHHRQVVRDEQVRQAQLRAQAIEPASGGTVSFSGDPNLTDSTGQVLAYDPPRHLAFTWGGDELHLTLEPVGVTGTRLVLINVLADLDAAARNAAGWAVCLAELDLVLAGRPGDGPHGPAAAARWRPSYEAHLAAGLPGGAPVPDSA